MHQNDRKHSRESVDFSDYLTRKDRNRKRLFIGLVMLTSFVVCLFLASLWIVPYYGFEAIHPYAPWIAGFMVASIMGLVIWASLGLLLNAAFGMTIPFFKKMRGITVKLFLPIMTILGRIFGISKNKIRSSFIKVNNELVLSEAGQYKPSEILLLMPHCLQKSKCKIRLTYNIYNCKRCGKCPITGLLELSNKYGIFLAIATGGTIARRIVVQRRPKIILAVACQRDLASGIQDTYPLPVYGVLNERPHGPCLDTLVPLDHLEKAILRFLDPAWYPENLTEDMRAAVQKSLAGSNAKSRPPVKDESGKDEARAEDGIHGAGAGAAA